MFVDAYSWLIVHRNAFEGVQLISAPWEKMFQIVLGYDFASWLPAFSSQCKGGASWFYIEEK